MKIALTIVVWVNLFGFVLLQVNKRRFLLSIEDFEEKEKGIQDIVEKILYFIWAPIAIISYLFSQAQPQLGVFSSEVLLVLTIFLFYSLAFTLGLFSKALWKTFNLIFILFIVARGLTLDLFTKD
jgi:hypothetical protein